MFCIIWEYRVKEDYLTEFESMYSPSGSWVSLFKKYDGFISTELLRAKVKGNVYVTIDRWKSEDDYQTFIELSINEYSAFESTAENYREFEELIGRFIVC